MVKLKNEVTGFIYDSCYGKVTTIFTEPVNIFTIQTTEDEVFIDNDFVNELFEFKSNQQLQNCSEGLSKVLEWVD